MHGKGSSKSVNYRCLPRRHHHGTPRIETLMPIIGLIGGIAPPSTIDYYKLLIEKYRGRHPDSFPHILINSIDLAAMLALVAANNLDALTDFLAYEIDRLARAGAEIAII